MGKVVDTQFETKRSGSKPGKDEWLTPPSIIQALGGSESFDLDPCASIERPWPTAKQHYTYIDNGLLMPWFGRVFCNPPYGKHTDIWLQKCAMHRNAIALTFARTETSMFHRTVWDAATSVLFLRGRISFYNTAGNKGGAAGAPSVLIAYDEANSELLLKSKIKGKFIHLKR